MNKEKLEESTEVFLQFGDSGLIPAIVQEKDSGEILMLGYVNEEAFNLTVETGYATFWSRSRNEIWKKGETSGNLMKITDILVDCDQDCVIYKVSKVSGGACHTKNSSGEYRKSCFYRKYDFENHNLENSDI